jgi:hypothetical protein
MTSSFEQEQLVAAAMNSSASEEQGLSAASSASASSQKAFGRSQRKESLFIYSSYQKVDTSPKPKNVSEKKSVSFKYEELDSSEHATSMLKKKSGRTTRRKLGLPSADASESHAQPSLLKRLQQIIFRWFLRIFACNRLMVALITFIIFIGLATYISYIMSKQAASSCAGAPYIYITHGGSKNILKFSRDGCAVATRVLWGNYDQSDLRGIAFGQRYGKPTLFVADANRDSSQILVFGKCSSWSGLRQMTGRVVSADVNSAAMHPYGLTIDDENNIYASFQDTDVVLRFAKDSFEPLPLPPMLAATNKLLKKIAKNQQKSKADDSNDDNSSSDGTDSLAIDAMQEGSSSTTSNTSYALGTFIQFGEIGFHKHNEEGIRGIAYVRGIPAVNASSPNATAPHLRRRQRAQHYRRQLANNSSGMSISGWQRQPTLWVANKNYDAVLVFSTIYGNLTAMLPLVNPIGLHVDYHHNLVFAGSKQKKNAMVIAYDMDSLRPVRKFTLLSMKHPTSMASYKDELFVTDQTANAIWSFNITSGRYNRLVVSSDSLATLHVADLEVMLLSDC